MTVHVGSLTYRATNLPKHVAALRAVSAGIPARLFGSKTKLWTFADADGLVDALAELHRSNWAGEPQAPPSALSLKYASPSGTAKAGTVRIGRLQKFVDYPTLSDLEQAEVYQALVKGAAWLGSDEFAALVADPVAWRFANWSEVDAALRDWAKDTPYPTQLLDHRVVTRPASVRSFYDPEKMAFSKSEFRNFFGACGSTAKFLIGRVQDLGGQVEQVAYEKDLHGSDGADKLSELVQADYPGPVLINVVNDTVHEFVLERATDGKMALFQAYIGAYDALWWANLERSRIGINGEELSAMEKLRAVYGEGQAIPLSTLLENLRAFMMVDQLHNAGIAWRNLPFRPDQKLNDSGRPCFDVTVWHITRPQAVLNALRAREIIEPGFASWVGLAVLKEAEKVAP